VFAVSFGLRKGMVVAMLSFFHVQHIPRLKIGAAATILMWALYVRRVTLGTGPMHDHEGHQAPELHYLVGAAVVTGVVASWIITRALMPGWRRRSQ
jgi:hypothetical protein